MHAHDGMDTLNMLGTGIGIIAVEVRVRGFEVCLLAINDLAEAWTEFLISSITGSPQSISADRWHDIVVEMCDARRLTLMNQIGVPTRSTARVSEVGSSFSCLQSRPDHRDAFDARDLRYLRLCLCQHMDSRICSASTYVNFNLSIMLAKLLLLLGRNVLITEEDNTSFGDQQCQLVPLLIREVLQLQTVDFCADVSCQVFDLACSFEERSLCRIDLLCSSASIVMLPGLVSDVVGILEVEGTSWTVRIAIREIDIGLLKTSASFFGKTKCVLAWLDYIGD